MDPDTDLLDALVRAALPYAWGPDKNFVALADSLEQPVILTTAQLAIPGPVVLYANFAFRKMCSYSLDQLVGRSPRVLQGEKTAKAIVATFREELGRTGKASMKVVNYRADGTDYGVHITAKFSPAVPPYDDVFIATQREIPVAEALAAADLSSLH